ncbi:MAG: AAA family ATPase [Rivularia sp. T60_A2020_040]|nr:AAA family ATPase [Rivularia sp. T60_A2020_040]
MKIESITLKGFRCFGNTPTTVNLSEEITALIGANGSGKTALLEAMSRVFGITNKQRTIISTDFYAFADPSNNNSSKREFELYIDIRLIFTELEENPNSTSSNLAVPACFHHMVVTNTDETPFVRIRLEAKWVDDRTIDGDIEQKLWWVTTDKETPMDDEKRQCEASERGLIQVHYIPATRDPSSQLTSATGAIIGRLLRAVSWSNEAQESIQEASQKIREVFGKEQAIDRINKVLASRWQELHNDTFDSQPEFNVASRQFKEIIRRLNVVFRPTESDSERDLDALSDGQKSLFYFSLVASVFEVEQNFIYRNNIKNSDAVGKNDSSVDQSHNTGFNSDQFTAPALIIFAFEEPENHLAPYFLSRIIKQLRSLVKEYSTQAVLTSHSPAILGRIQPEEVRHFRLIQESRTVSVNEIKLPDKNDTKYKYIREAVNAYPELYFARFVILGEGDSEQVVLPKLASAMGLEVDPSFVAIVPLGGRHVNHFWKLLKELDIPYATLLDLDYGRKGAGWGRIKYAFKQLIEIGVPSEEILEFSDSNGNKHKISEEELEPLHTQQDSIEEINNFVTHLEKFGVFFSSPLDLDMAMLSCFPDVYKNTQNSQPRTSQDDAIKAVLSNDADKYQSAYSDVLELFPWYKYLFLTKSKPSTHLQALCEISEEDLNSKAPSILKKLLEYAHTKLR